MYEIIPPAKSAGNPDETMFDGLGQVFRVGANYVPHLIGPYAFRMERDLGFSAVIRKRSAFGSGDGNKG